MTAGRESAARVSSYSAGSEQIETVIIDVGQAGLSVAYHLARRGRPFVILDSYGRIGDAWRNRWDSLRLFTPAWLDGLAGMPFPAPRHSFPGNAQMADYLESYAAQSELPVRTGITVEKLSRKEDRFVVAAGEQQIEHRLVRFEHAAHADQGSANQGTQLMQPGKSRACQCRQRRTQLLRLSVAAWPHLDPPHLLCRHIGTDALLASALRAPLTSPRRHPAFQRRFS